MRIASLLPSATEILFAIGAGDEVVGVTHECDHPSAAQRLPQLTSSAIDHDGQACATIDRHIKAALHAGSSIYRLDEDLLRRLDPDLIVTQELCEVCAVGYAEVERAARRLPGEVPVLSLEPTSLDEIGATVEAVGRASGHEVEAGEAVRDLGLRIAAVEALPAPTITPRVVCIEWADPLMAGGHWVPEMVRRAGGRDPLGREGQLSHYVSWEEVLAAAPDVLVLMPCGYGLEQTLAVADQVTSRPGFDNLPCAQSRRVVAVDGSSYYNRPGPRIVDGLQIMATIIRAKPGDPLREGAGWVTA